jgi:photosystem II stability/assembly factor-like uncharacterized protein
MPNMKWTGWARLWGAVAVLAVVAVAIGSARSTSGRSTTPTASATAGTPPSIEDEAGQSPDGPDIFQDFKDSSGQDVTGAQLARAQAQANSIASAPDAGSWQLTGPTNVGGRVVDLVVDNQAPNTLYVATSGGGIWKSSDAGMTYSSVWPTARTQTMGSIAQASDGTLYVGTGEANPSGGGLTYFGDGMYKSSDGGQSWTHIGLDDSAAIGRVAVDPTNPSVAYAAASGSISRTVGQRGLYKTTDGGTTWTQVLAPPNATTGAIDVAIDPANPQRVYASLWDHHRNNGARVYGGIGSGLFRSDDGGATWTRLQNITTPLPSYDTAQTGLKADASLGRIGIAIAPSDPNRVYVVTGAPYGPDKGTFVSNDGGDSFQTIGRAYANGGYQWWFGRIWVDPANENHLFNADVSLRESTDGGLTWHNSNGPHSDQHALAWDPRVPNRVYNGDDGGIYRSDQNGASGTWNHATYEPWNQSYHLAVAPDNDNRMATGLQDNGSVRDWTAAAPNPADVSQFNSYGGGDGHWVAIDPNNANTYFACSQNASCQGSSDNTTTGTTTRWTFHYPSGLRYTTDAPIGFDPSNTQTMYVGGEALLKSTDQGHTAFTAISPTDEPSSLPGVVPADEQDLGGEYANLYGSVSAFAVAAGTGGSTIFAGTDTGKLWKTSNGGASWTQMQGVPTRWVNAVVVDPANANHAFVAFSGYREGDDSANVYETLDGGTTWSNISANLPNAPVEMITYDQLSGNLYAATDYGVFERKNGDAGWYSLDGGLPNTPVLDVKVSNDHKWLYAATFGRSILRLPLSTSATLGGGGNGGGVGGAVPATLALTLGAPASFGTFIPGVANTYSASTTANVTSTAGDATLSVSDPDTTAPGHLVNGSFALPQPLQARATKADTQGTAFNPIGSFLNLLTWSAPVSNDAVSLLFRQPIASGDALRTGSYSKTLTFTLSTTSP